MTDTTGKSRVLTLVFTDLADSTALKTQRGDMVVGDLISRHRDIVTRLAEDCTGRIIDWAGDGCFLTFETSSAGVMFSLQLQQAHADEPDLPGVRVGIHMGEVTVKPGPGGPDSPPRIEGLAVDIAARISGLAKPGQVLMSTAVHNSARQRLGVDTFGQPILWQAHGTYELKGFDEPMDIREAGLEGVAPLDAPKSSEKAKLIRKAPRTNKGSRRKVRNPSNKFMPALIAVLILIIIAGGAYFAGTSRTSSPPAMPLDASETISSLVVLPFDNLMGDPEQEYFVDGMTDALSAELSKIKSLKVISRTSAMSYKGTAKTLPEIAAELGVEGVIEGSIMRSGNDIRITAQLIDGRTDQHVWGENYSGTIENILKLQGEVALDIAEQVHANITEAEKGRLASQTTVVPEAYEAYLKGTYFFYKFNQEGFRKAQELLLHTVELDPNFAEAYARLANAYWVPAWYYTPPIQTEIEAKEAIKKALALDDQLAKAHYMAGWAALTYDWDWERAEQEFRRAVELNPGDPDAYNGLTWYLVSLGRFDEAINAMNECIRLDPVNPIWQTFLAHVYSYAGLLEDAENTMSSVLELDPDFFQAYNDIVYRKMRSGDQEGALKAGKRAVELDNRSGYGLMSYGIALANAGKPEEAREIVSEMITLREKDENVSTNIAVVYAALGDMTEAFRWVDRAVDDRDFMVTMPTLSMWDWFRHDPRFAAMLKRIGYPAKVPLTPLLSALPDPTKIERIAVLPFANISGDAEQEWFVDGMTEALTMELAQIKSLTVISRTSAMQYKNVLKPMSEIASDLNAHALVEGSVVRVGNRVRITAQLIDGRTDEHLWANRYDGTLDDILNLQSEVALAIAQAIDVALTPEDEVRLTTERHIDPAALEAYLRGRHFWNKRTKKDILQAIEYFEEAIDLEPDYALAYTALADAYNVLAVFSYVSPDEGYKKAAEFARKAIGIDDSLAAAHISLAYALGWGNFDLESASREYERGLQLDPNSVQGYTWYASNLIFMNQPEKAFSLANRALAIDPVSHLGNTMKVGALYVLRRNEDAVELGRNFREIYPDFPTLLLMLGYSLIEAGEYNEAIATYNHLADLNGRQGGFLGYLGLSYAKAGEREKALATLSEIDETTLSESTKAYSKALVYFGLGDVDQTLTLLEQSTSERYRGLLEIYSLPLWDPLRDNPRFNKIVEGLNIPEPPESY